MAEAEEFLSIVYKVLNVYIKSQMFDSSISVLLPLPPSTSHAHLIFLESNHYPRCLDEVETTHATSMHPSGPVSGLSRRILSGVKGLWHAKQKKECGKANHPE